jgi:tetratricopeptide (TPR) repeat protein
MKRQHTFPRSSWTALALSLLILFALLTAPPVFAQDEEIDPEREEAVRLINENKYLEALPILEKIMLSYANDADLWAHFGIAIIANSIVLATPEERKEEQARAVKALKRAQQLGTDNVRALDLLDQFEGADGTDNFMAAEPEVEKALREGEAYFGRGEYEDAYKAYERAHKLDPKNYEAALFMGDCYYARKMYQEAEPWFAKAVELGPEREMAHRFWGDALLEQKKFAEAREKYINAAIADPYGRMSWSGLSRWAESSGGKFGFYEITPPGNEIGGTIEIDGKLLRQEDGTIHWREYVRTLDKLELGEAPADSDVPKFKTDIAAWKSVAAAFREDLKEGKIRYPDAGLVNLLKVEDEGFLEAYELLQRPYPHFSDYYPEFRKDNRGKLRDFIIKYMLFAGK